MALSTFILFRISHHHPSPDSFTFLNWNSVPIKHQVPLPPPHTPHPRSLAPTRELSDSMNATILGTSCKWNQRVFVCTYCISECIFFSECIFKANLSYTVSSHQSSLLYTVYIYMSIPISRFIPPPLPHLGSLHGVSLALHGFMSALLWYLILWDDTKWIHLGFRAQAVWAHRSYLPSDQRAY